MKIKKLSLILAAVICFGVSTFVYAAGNGDNCRERERLQNKDKSCQIVAMKGNGDTLRIFDRDRLKDGSCLL
ncbi:MAG: hypothetical protein HGA22_01610 [Clostridiales bacterium]|nr:hypothetical protein [Clostridiales bacterium]